MEVGNRLASRVALLVYYSLSFLCRFLLEQPQGSSASDHPRLSHLFATQRVWTQGIWGGAYAWDKGEATPKRHTLWSNDLRLLRELQLAAGHMSRQELDQFQGDPLVKRVRRDDGTYAWTGIKDRLSKSQLGPQFFVRLHLNSHFVSCRRFSCMPMGRVLARRAYHPKFGQHLAQLKLEMGKGYWEA